VTHLSRLDYRQEFILDLLNDAYARGRKTLFLSERKEELQSLERALHLTHPKKVVGICVGSLEGKKMPQEDKERALACPIILATAQLVKEALDKKEIDTLIIGFPQSSASFAEQASGRILRLDDDKKPPIVVVLVDYDVYVEEKGMKRRPFVQKAQQMQATFKRLGYKIIREV
jgi:superfamily II DNA or RNA helicase